MTHPILLLEINEVPWRLVDRFSRKGYRAIDCFFANSHTFTNVAVDTGELSPWVTWPTFHRGMTKEGHGIKHLGQAPSTFKGTPIWEEFRKQGYSIGIFGSLQSWPPIEPGKGGFYIPDTFAHDPSCIPSSLEPLQRFNLRQTATNKRVVEPSSILSKETLRLIRAVSFVRPQTVAGVAWQLISERGNKIRTSRRPVFQAILMWDAFRKLFDCTNPPAFSTFFTNHVAGVMHRYWHNLFPEDFGAKYAGRPIPYVSTMEFAMKVFDRILDDAMDYCARNPNLIVVVATSMGQSAIDREYHEGVQLVLKDFGKLADCLQIDRQSYRELLAMAPQTAVEIENAEIRKGAIQTLASCKTVSGTGLFKVEELGNSLSITTSLPTKADIEVGYWKMGDVSRSWSKSGIQVLHIDPGTAYHVKEGAMAVYGARIKRNASRHVLHTDQAKNFLLELAGLAYHTGLSRRVVGQHT